MSRLLCVAVLLGLQCYGSKQGICGVVSDLEALVIFFVGVVIGWLSVGLCFWLSRWDRLDSGSFDEAVYMMMQEQWIRRLHDAGIEQPKGN